MIPATTPLRPPTSMVIPLPGHFHNYTSHPKNLSFNVCFSNFHLLPFQLVAPSPIILNSNRTYNASISCLFTGCYRLPSITHLRLHGSSFKSLSVPLLPPPWGTIWQNPNPNLIQPAVCLEPEVMVSQLCFISLVYTLSQTLKNYFLPYPPYRNLNTCSLIRALTQWVCFLFPQDIFGRHISVPMVCLPTGYYKGSFQALLPGTRLLSSCVFTLSHTIAFHGPLNYSQQHPNMSSCLLSGKWNPLLIPEPPRDAALFLYAPWQKKNLLQTISACCLQFLSSHLSWIHPSHVVPPGP